jgi:hypothetical protein
MKCQNTSAEQHSTILAEVTSCFDFRILRHTKEIMTKWNEACAAGGLCQKPGGSNTAGPAHKCVECSLNVHTICAVPWDDVNASFGEGLKCFECAGTRQPPSVPPPPPDAAATSPRQPQEEEQKEEQQQQQQQQQPQEEQPPAPRPRHPRFATSDIDWTMPKSLSYRPYIISVMSFFHCSKYPKEKTFTRAELLELTPEVIKRWLARMAYGKEDYVVGVDMPRLMRSSTLKQAKKAVSFFMPHNKPAWCNGQGNPTKDSSVSGVISDVLKSEVRRQGVPSKAKRPLRELEFRKTNEMLRKQVDWVRRYKYPAMTLWQYHLIGRVDDTAHFEVSDPRGHDLYDFSLKTRVRWSKNVMDERSCPDQILLGAYDDEFCIFIMLSIYLESFLEQHPNPKYLFCVQNDDDAPNKLKANYWCGGRGVVVLRRRSIIDVCD